MRDSIIANHECEKFRTTMNSRASITIENGRGEYLFLESQGVVRGLMEKADVNDWQAVQYVVIPEGLLLGKWRPCLVMVQK